MLHQDHHAESAHRLDPWLPTLQKSYAPSALAADPVASATTPGHAAAHHAPDAAAHTALFDGMYGDHAVHDVGGHTVGGHHEPHMSRLHGPTTLFAKGKGDKNSVALNDIKQGQVGDCFFLSSMGAELTHHPNLIKKMIHQHHGKHGMNYTVDFKEKQQDGHYADTPVTVDGRFPTNGMHANLSGDKRHGAQEIWPLIMEKAYAQLHNGYHTIDKGGNPGHAMSELTGRDSQIINPEELSAKELIKDAKEGKGICFDSMKHPGHGLVGSHAYSLKSVVSDGHGGQMVRLNNPWGTHQPKDIPFSQIKKEFNEVDVN